MSRPHADFRAAAASLSLLLLLGACASTPQRAEPPGPFDVPDRRWSAAEPVVAGADASLAQWWQRFDDPLLAQLVDAGPAGQHQRARRAGRAAAGARAARRRPRRRCRPRSAARPRRSAARSGGDSTGNSLPGRPRRELGASTSSAPTAARSMPARPRAAASARQPGRRAGRRSPPRWRSATSRCAARRRGWRSPSDNLASQQETLQITAVARSRPAWSPRSKPSRRARAAEQTRAQLPALQTAHRAGRPRARRAHRPAAGGAGMPCWPPRRRCRSPPATWRWPSPPRRCASAPDVRAAEHQVSAALAARRRRPTPRAARASGSAARWA